MTKNYLKFNNHGRPLFSVVPKRVMRMREHGGACLRTDGGTPDPDEDEDEDEDADEKAPEKKLLKTMQKRFVTELEKRGYVNTDGMTAAIKESLKDINLDALREYDTNKEKLDKQIKKLAGDLEKVRNTPVAGSEKRNYFREGLDKTLVDAEVLYNQREKKGEVSLHVRAAAVMTTVNTIDEATHSVPVDLLENFTMGEFVSKRRGVQFIYEIASRTVVQKISQYKTWLEEGNEQGAFAIVAEGAVKPLVSYDLVRNFAKAKKVAAKYIITEEFAKFRENAYSIIRGLIMDKIIRDYNALLTVDLNAQAAGYVGTALDGTVVAPNDYDAIGAVAAQIETLNFQPDILIIHPQDEWRIRLSKDSEGRYLFPTTTENGQTIMLGLRVFKTTYQDLGYFTLGESGLFKIEEEPMTVRLGYGITVTGANPVTQVVGDFDNNQMRVIVETYFNDYIATHHIGSFVKASFATVKAALQA